MIGIGDLTFRLGNRILLDHASCVVPTGARVGLVGRNGAGKSTLFKLITGELAAESGTISMPRQAKLGIVEQEAPGGDETILDFVLAADKERIALLQEAETSENPIRIAEIHARLHDIGAHSAPARAAEILSGLGFDAEGQQRPCESFSGGWRMRVALAAMLFLQPDLLLLDEPTNYLDLEGSLWLKEHLKKYPHTLVLISHDRDFLDTVNDHILHLDQMKLVLYRGNYSNFERQRAEKAMLALKQSEKIEAERKHLQAFIDRFKAKASKARQAQSRVKRLEKLEEVALLAPEQEVSIDFPDPERPLSPPILAMDRACAGYGERTVLSGLDLTISDDDRIGLLGANGNGKSTLVKLIAGRIDPLSGIVKRAAKLKIAYFAQHQLDELPESASPYSLVRAKLPTAFESVVRARTARLGFPEAKAETPIAKLSGGEKARLLLGLAAFDGPHLLILDEPTNHLDIPMRDALVEALAAYRGAVIIVSHDRALIDSSCDRLWLVDQGRVKPFDGDIEDYERFVLAKGGGPEKAERTSDRPGTDRRREAERRVALKPLRDKLKQVEADIERFQSLIEKADAMLADADTFAKSPEKAAKLARDRAVLAERLASAEEEWLALSETLENAQAPIA